MRKILFGILLLTVIPATGIFAYYTSDTSDRPYNYLPFIDNFSAHLFGRFVIIGIFYLACMSILTGGVILIKEGLKRNKQNR